MTGNGTESGWSDRAGRGRIGKARHQVMVTDLARYAGGIDWAPPGAPLCMYHIACVLNVFGFLATMTRGEGR